MRHTNNLIPSDTVVLTFGVAAVSLVHVPSKCSHFNLTDPSLAIRSPLESTQRNELQRRFLIPPSGNMVEMMSHAIVASITKTLPHSTPIQSSCLIDIDSSSHFTIDFLRSMYRSGKYKVCILCDKLDAGNGTCDKLTFCPSTSYCYYGHNLNHNTSLDKLNPLYPIINPYAASHGCCDQKDPLCHHRHYIVKDASNSKINRANYTISTCTGFLCNADPSLKTRTSKLLHRLIDGHLSSWTTWTSCSHTCGFSTRRRTRACNNPSPFHGGRSCSGSTSNTAVCHVAACPVAGGWSKWTHWSTCSRTCGNGTHTRNRTCTNPSPSHGGHTCSGHSSASGSCINQLCPVAGGWTKWTHWSTCSRTCGYGAHTRIRNCTNPPPSNGGHTCSGLHSVSSKCINQLCPVDGHWTTWQSWTPCSQTCGIGAMSRSRFCTNPSPAHGGQLCSGDASTASTCELRHCPVDGKWSEWQTWSACSVSCATGMKNRTRACDNPPASNGGRPCHGFSTVTFECNNGECPVDGGWSEWHTWSACSVSCTAGTKTRTRACNNPPASSGGKHCHGSPTEKLACDNGVCPGWSSWFYGPCSVTCGNGTTSRLRHCSSGQDGDCKGVPVEHIACQDRPCPIDGQWAAWQHWGACTQSCGEGKQVRNRTCSNPAPAQGGVACTGSAGDTRVCNKQHCPVAGRWTKWTHWTTCSRTCGHGTHTRNRTCTDPPPSHGGHTCNGHSSASYTCILQHCPVDGKWSEWHTWLSCSVSCTAGIKTRTRACDNPPASNGGKHCRGPSTGKLACDNGVCPVWSSWYYGRCSVTCGNGTTSRFRHCSSGKDGDCHGAPTEDVDCQDRPCPIDGQWAAWQHWGACTQSCGEGKHVRNRTCSNPAPAHGGAACTGSTDDTQVCNTQQCPVAGRWTKWTHWSSCSRTCGNGTHTRHRTCTNPPPSHGGHTCSGSSSSSHKCINTLCPVDGHWATWQAWTSCSQTCGRGVMSRSRTCTSPAPANGGKSCSGDVAMASTCELRHCPVDGGWSEWHAWSTCSVSCTAGIKTRTRACDNPPASNCGKQCHGSLTEKLACDNGVCPVWSSWFYGRCSVTCGNGTTSRLRHCSSGKDGDCHGAPTEDVACQDRQCPIDGQWTAWQKWSACTQSCGEGKHVRNRTCSNPAPAHGGAVCAGDANESGVCNTQQCPHWLDYHEVGTCSVSCGEGVIQLERKCSTGNRADCTGSPYNEKPCAVIMC